VVTESGILHQMRKLVPDKLIIPAPPTSNCACNECPYMRLNTLEKIYLAMKTKSPELVLPEATRLAALAPMQRMLAMS
jgi:quinolinate synthase